MPRPQKKSAKEKKEEQEEAERRQAEEEEAQRQAEEEEEQEEEQPEEEFEEEWLVVIGGFDGETVHASVELLNFKGEAFEEGLSLESPRWGCAAVTLQESGSDSDQILVVGGFDGKNYLDTTEIIDLKKWTISPGPKLGIARAGCSAVRINQKEILIVGGYSEDTCEILDLSTMMFKIGPHMRQARSCAAVTMMDENRLLVAGGFDRLGCCLTTEIMDLRKAPHVDDWDDLSPPDLQKARFFPWESLKEPRGACTCSVISGGRIIFAGGFEGKRRLRSTELLDLGNYNVPFQKMAPSIGDVAVSAFNAEIVANIYKEKKTKGEGDPDGEDAESAEDEEEEDEQTENNPIINDDENERIKEADGPVKKKKAWVLKLDEVATVVGVYSEGMEDVEGFDGAEPGTVKMRNPDGIESKWQSIEEFSHPPKHEMRWCPNSPPLCNCRSGSASAVLPLDERDGQKPRLFIIGGCSEVPNESLAETEFLQVVPNDADFDVQFQLGPATIARRAYCAAVTATVFGKLGRPEPEEDVVEEDAVEEENAEELKEVGETRRTSTVVI